jgi:hypothetical protein
MSQQPEDATWEPIEGEHEILTSAAAPSMIHSPMLRRRGSNEVEIVGLCDDQSAIPWGFWSGAAAIALLIGFVAMKGAGGGIFAMRDVLIAVILGGIAVAMFRYGPSGNQRMIELATIDLERRQLAWASRSESSGPQLVATFEEISEVVFAMISFPVSPARPDARIHVYTLLIRVAGWGGVDEGELVPVIEASPNKREVFVIAQQIAAASGVEVTQIGEGIRLS